MISVIFTAVSSAITGFSSALASAVSGVTAMFATESSGTYTLTMLGSLLCIGLGIGLVYWAFRTIRSLVKARG